MVRRHLLVLILATLAMAAIAARAGRVESDLSGSGWSLWLDREAKWQEDELFLPPADVAKLPVNLPTGGWAVLQGVGATPVSVPGTVEEYLQDGKGPETDISGVSWWWRTIRVPEASVPRRVLLKFDSVRHRAEVFVNRRLVGYDLVGNTPFEVDITDAVTAGEECQLAVRITDPGGNFDWRDSSTFNWGKYKIPMSHGFGGITGRVRLETRELVNGAIYVTDIYVQNTPEPNRVNVHVTVQNGSGEPHRRNVSLTVDEKNGGNLVAPIIRTVQVAPGENRFEFTISEPRAKLWDLEHPNLYVCSASVAPGDDFRDIVKQAFGFRWFAPEEVGKDAVFRLNGKRIFLRTAISWGFWPINGIFPSPELAEREIRTAKALGQNMLNFHRAIGHPISFEKADELGLLIYEEPGGYGSAKTDPFAQALAREKLLRMVKRDRSHPSLVVYNMVNESANLSPGDPMLKVRTQDMRDAHALDPSRTITHTSAWAREPEDSSKMHMRPFDDTVHMRGWYDFHHAGGPEVWRQDLYKGPRDHYGWTDNNEEIVFWGEEGAISTPPRVELINAELAKAPRLGWDGAVYRDWFRAFDDFLTRKNLRSAFATVDALTTSLGAISLEHQARKIEQHRISNANDGYAVNGWEAQIIENHSGIVDCFRNAKGDEAIMRERSKSPRVAVRLRSQFAQIPGEVLADFYVINESDLKGERTLKVTATDPRGREVFSKQLPVKLTGGETYGELLAAGIALPIVSPAGLFRVEAEIVGTDARGSEEVLAVDWKSAKLGGAGAVWEAGSRVGNFLKDQKQLDAAAYRDDLGRLDWVIAARPPDEGATTNIPPDRFRELRATFFRGNNFAEKLHERADTAVELVVPEGATPDPAVPMTEGYSVRWQGELLPPASGRYNFTARCDGGIRLTVNGQPVIDVIRGRDLQTYRGAIELEVGKPAAITFEFIQQRRQARCTLSWAVPEKDPPDPQRLIDRVRNDGTTLLVLDRADSWLELIQKNTGVKFTGTFKIGTAWLGGNHFVREHPLFRDLPVNGAMNWPYQALVRDGRTRFGVLAEGEDLIAGAWHSHPMQLGTAVGIIACGKGRIIFSSLDIVENLANPASPAEVARKLLCNFIEFANTP